MHGTAVSILAETPERLAILQQRIEATQAAHVVFAHSAFPASSTDQIVRRVQEAQSEVVVIDVDPDSARNALRAIELIHSNVAETSVFAVGGMNDPTAIVAAMRAGAREYLERHCSTESFADALRRFAELTAKARASSGRARILAVTNAKGGAGATTVAVNTAIALEQSHGRTVLVDFALLGHAALHLNVRPAFGVADALQNLHRMDASLLQSLLTSCKGGLHLLAGAQQPSQFTPSAAEIARLFDLLVSHFQYVIVDCSNRTDSLFRLIADLSNAVLLVTQTDVVSLWSAARMRSFLEQGTGRDRVCLVLNRFKKIPGLSDEDVHKITTCKLLWKLPNNFHAIGPAIDKGNPIAFNEGNDLGRSFHAFASLLAAATNAENSRDLSFSPLKATDKKTLGNLLISPLRAGQ
jgi:Flp pilus assembly CpaE family ATPase